MRNIDDILKFRSDISPFLVHLTRDIPNVQTAKMALESIINNGQLVCGQNLVSDAKYGINTLNMLQADKERYFSAICFTETPLNEVHCLLEIAYRQIDLKPYGLVFRKDKLKERGVSPVFYLNNEKGDKNSLVRSLCKLITNFPNEAANFLPLVTVFGQKLTAPGAEPVEGRVDFCWEREWRYPKVCGPLEFDVQDIFVGLCPHSDIEHFEALLPSIKFVDPTRNLRWYATKLIEARQDLDIKFSVV